MSNCPAFHTLSVLVAHEDTTHFVPIRVAKTTANFARELCSSGHVAATDGRGHRTRNSCARHLLTFS